ncbi:MAG: nitrate- and nitrite sensing domain-containing protein [Roseobacter sp.]|nr:nitrate- and nitrite sensing domain-containing protein [Roseobacter sp.]
MTRFLSKSLFNAMIGSVVLPVIFGVIVASVLILQQIQWLKQSYALKDSIEIVYDLGALIHEQQKERGATSVFLSSGGAQFGPELQDQRRNTDREAADFQARVDDIGRENLLPELLVEVDALMAGLAQRGQIRQRVDALDIPTPEALGHYTKHNARILNAVKKVGAISSDPGIMVKVIALQSLLTAKEFAGIERAIGSGGFASGSFAANRVLLHQSLVSQQSFALTQFSALTTDEWREVLAGIGSTPEAVAIEDMRQVIQQSLTTNDLQGITAQDFFSATTVRINAFKELEDTLIGEVNALAKAQNASSLSFSIALAGGILVVLLASLAVTRFSVRNMLRAVRRISNAGDRLAKGDRDVEMPTEVPAELGRIVWSINYFRKSVIEAQEREAEILEQRNRSDAKARDIEAERQKAERERAQQEAATAREEQMKLEEYTKELASVVSACAIGDFSRRLSLEGKEGVLSEIADGLNQISDGVADSLEEIKRALGHLAKGDMTYRMSNHHRGVFSEISEAMTEATANMSRTVSSVHQAAGSVSASADEISTATDDLARRSENNAAMLQRTAATVDDMSKSISVAADAANSAKSQVGEVSAKAANGSKIASGMISAMKEIQGSSEDIVKILAVIDDIAFQTNLLALNAGVEAARAGDAGRGFAVVASEVRALAQRSSESGQEIANLLEVSSASIERGVEMVDQTAGALNGIASDVELVSHEMEQIAASFEENRKSIEVVSSAPAELDASTQKNAAMFEETNAAAQLLDGEAKSLMKEVSSFEISNDMAVASSAGLLAARQVAAE